MYINNNTSDNCKQKATEDFFIMYIALNIIDYNHNNTLHSQRRILKKYFKITIMVTY
jgi:hypothetical protein